MMMVEGLNIPFDQMQMFILSDLKPQAMYLKVFSLCESLCIEMMGLFNGR